MGRRTHGQPLLIAIDANNRSKVHEILAGQLRNKNKIRDVCTADIRRLPSEVVDCPLLLAASLPDPTILRYMCVKHQVDINFVHKSGSGRNVKINTPLIQAVKKGYLCTVEAILALSADTNIQNHRGKSALHYAIQKANYRLAKMLLCKGAQPNLLNEEKASPLHVASKYGHVELVKLLLQYGGDLYKQGESSSSGKHYFLLFF